MEELVLELPEERSETYRHRAEAAISAAARARNEAVAASYCRLADVWEKLAATVEPAKKARHSKAG
jgi:hypothetical protein